MKQFVFYTYLLFMKLITFFKLESHGKKNSIISLEVWPLEEIVCIDME